MDSAFAFPVCAESFHRLLWRDRKSFPPIYLVKLSTTTEFAAKVSDIAAFWRKNRYFCSGNRSFPKIIHRKSPVLPHETVARDLTKPLSNIDNSVFHSFHPHYGYYFWYPQVFSGKVSCCQTRVRACINPRLPFDRGDKPPHKPRLLRIY